MGSRLQALASALAHVLLLSEAALLGLVVIACVTILGILGLLVLAVGSAGGWWRRGETLAPTRSSPVAAPGVVRPRMPASFLRNVEIDVPTKHVDAFVGALRAAGWNVRETGEVVATEDDEEGLTTIAVDVPSRPEPGSGEEIR